jgi:hypothetical protein
MQQLEAHVHAVRIHFDRFRSVVTAVETEAGVTVYEEGRLKLAETEFAATQGGG